MSFQLRDFSLLQLGQMSALGHEFLGHLCDGHDELVLLFFDDLHAPRCGVVNGGNGLPDFGKLRFPDDPAFGL